MEKQIINGLKMLQTKIKYKKIIFLVILTFSTPSVVFSSLPIAYLNTSGYEPAQQEAAQGKNGMITTQHFIATAVGEKILNQGGNAYDASIAIAFTLAVVLPRAGNIGGGGFMVMYDNETMQPYSIDYREKAPMNAFSDMYLDENKKVLSEKSVLGGLAVGVPGTVAGMYSLHQKLGNLSWEQVIAPAVALAKNGFVVTSKQAQVLSNKRFEIISMNGSNTLFAHPFSTGDRVCNLPLSTLLNKIAREGPKAFYKGPNAEAMVEKINNSGGIFSLEDLENYEPVWREPIQFNYKDLKLYSMGPPSSGGICLAQMLGMVEQFPIGTYGFHSEKAMQLMIEAERRSFADRSHYLGDSDFIDVPINKLLDSIYLLKRMQSFAFEKATPSTDIAPGILIAKEADETTHFSILDLEGNAVAVTTTLNGNYGSKLYVEEGGYFLNNEMDDFSSKPGVPNMFGLVGGTANEIAPEKRMLSAMTPTIVEKDGQLTMIAGTPGGSTIITSVFQTILNVYDFKITWGALIFPLVVVITDLTVRLVGKRIAQKTIFFSYPLFFK